jgi:hypothetical protein
MRIFDAAPASDANIPLDSVFLPIVGQSWIPLAAREDMTASRRSALMKGELCGPIAIRCSGKHRMTSGGNQGKPRRSVDTHMTDVRMRSKLQNTRSRAQAGRNTSSSLNIELLMVASEGMKTSRVTVFRSISGLAPSPFMNSSCLVSPPRFDNCCRRQLQSI